MRAPLALAVPLVVSLIASLHPLAAAAQVPAAEAIPADKAPADTAAAGRGTAHLVGWPDDAADGEWYGRLRRADLIAFIDTLTLGYAWRVEEDVPFVEASLSWTPGEGGILDGRRVKAELLPPDVRLVALALDADVVVEGERIGGLAVEIDSLALAPAPDVYAFATGPLEWSTLFTGASAGETREALSRGFTLENLRLRSIAFGADYEEEDEKGPYTVVNDPRRPRRVGIYTGEPSIFIDANLGWLLGRPARPPQRAGRARGDDVGRGGTVSDGRTTRTRGGRGVDADPGSGRIDRGADRGVDRSPEPAGRPGTGRVERGGEEETPSVRGGESRRRGGLFGSIGRNDRGDSDDEESDDEESDDEESDDDSNELLPTSLAAAAAVGVLAYHAGTVGYLGQTRYAPVGVTAGYVRPGGGFLVHAGASEAVLTSGDGPRHAVGGIYGFWNAVGLPIQPALGLGLLATDEGETVRIEPSISAGFALNAGPVVGLVAWDLVHGGVGVGAAFNFRSSALRGR